VAWTAEGEAPAAFARREEKANRAELDPVLAEALADEAPSWCSRAGAPPPPIDAAPPELRSSHFSQGLPRWTGAISNHAAAVSAGLSISMSSVASPVSSEALLQPVRMTTEEISARAQ